ncbi:glycosyltransferase [uncultured Paraglaciecola sp.]|jgi:UDP-N-acetylglucosamine transferase subunit ALG13|uniref:glycosyltransferase n=1 Tax=uncultured Paraglaciecola sp. TaxID=1765024 RepID=UPI002626C9AF|nr:glycosyltransferase [uncultured Paraglaciecola sp.]|tara:strand:- start:787 stop:1266 length:480 start_codon:yes stop_codon:yes gene_type:complete
MIFLTVGTQLPFDRFVKIVDAWAYIHPEEEVFAQIAEGSYVPKHMQYIDYLSEQQYSEVFNKSEVILAHAAMGSVISSLMASKPIIIYPRKASLGEHRNEHQLATCSKLSHLDGCYIASEPEQLYSHLSDLRSLHGGAISPYANQDLLETIENFIVRNA